MTAVLFVYWSCVSVNVDLDVVLALGLTFFLCVRQCQILAMECISTLLPASMTFFGPA